ncbi:TetR/AcrR family transcriptional regulator [Pseudonocardia sp. MH-G8]|uniref:TetR/AcrR family transcriptional regulator n=1 Tax=Pseudonocardia sp. MH-G8 TaxID=1854588 RepID=UPI000BA07A20|nr:TetR/AcrR family transcriptional regulator [Pseudonocardia sp. MH-G8]OZM83868.1 TetR family transcriptional regulator [Pseudonocardia sp. MH-G8]
MASRPARRTTPKGVQARARIVAEAARIFARDGYRAGSLAAIADAAGLTQPGLLHYFPTKAALLLALIEERDARTASFVREHTGSSDPAETALDGFVDGVRHNTEEPHLVELMTVLSAESISPDHPAHDWFVRRYEELVARLAAGVSLEQRVGRWHSEIDPVHAARLLVGLADGLRLQRLLGRPDLDHAALLADLLRRLRSGSHD